MATAEPTLEVVPDMPSVDGLGDPVFALSPDGILLYANTIASEVLGWVAADVDRHLGASNSSILPTSGWRSRRCRPWPPNASAS